MGQVRASLQDHLHFFRGQTGVIDALEGGGVGVEHAEVEVPPRAAHSWEHSGGFLYCQVFEDYLKHWIVKASPKIEKRISDELRQK